MWQTTRVEIDIVMIGLRNTYSPRLAYRHTHLRQMLWLFQHCLHDISSLTFCISPSLFPSFLSRFRPLPIHFLSIFASGLPLSWLTFIQPFILISLLSHFHYYGRKSSKFYSHGRAIKQVRIKFKPFLYGANILERRHYFEAYSSSF